MSSEQTDRSPKPAASLVHDGESNGDGNGDELECRVAKKRKLDVAGANCSTAFAPGSSNDNDEATTALSPQPPPPPPPPPRQRLRDVVRSLSAKWRVQKRRLLDAGTPIEDHKAALVKLRRANVTGEGGGSITGFDLNSVVQKRWVGWDASDVGAIRPMAYFAMQGDLPMMRWLYVHGASTTDDDVVYWFPIMAAVFANTNSHVEVCQWLYKHGAQDDVSRKYLSTHSVYRPYCSPFAVAFYDGSFHRQSKRDVARWLILRGALCHTCTRNTDEYSSDKVDITRLRNDLTYCPTSTTHNERAYLFEWVEEMLQSRGGFDTFLMGTAKSVGRRHPLRMLSGNRDILERIHHFSGIIRGKEVRILRQLKSMLPRVDTELRLRR